MTVLLDPGLGYSDARLKALHRLWQDKTEAHKIEARGALPSRAEFTPLEMRDFLSDLYMVDVAHSGRFRYRLIGTAITQRVGRDVTGKYFDQIYAPEVLENFCASFHWIARHKLPLRSYGTMAFSDQEYLSFEALEVPLASDGVTVDIILGVVAVRSAK
ncbi:PAS domain-containing protein [Ferrovibrio sp. MS7]|uniref:PAS domain-containing protein n=1 Tax=Ferrovibrio plantarum TaxID=3119164 RepID=UPI003136B4E0